MLSNHEKEQYDRQLRLPEVGEQGQLRLRKARVLVVGAGGLGCPLLSYLVAAGIGHITIMDGDVVALSNLQRQLLFRHKDIGLNKAIVARERVLEINPLLSITAVSQHLNKDFALNQFHEFDLVVDCTDNFGTRYLINDVCVYFGIPFVSAGLYKFEGQVGIYNVKATSGTFSTNYRQAFPEAGTNINGIDCNEIGVIPTIPGLLGLYQANEVIKYFVSPEKVLLNQVLFIHVWDMKHRVFSFNPRAETIDRSEILNREYLIPVCKSAIKTITAQELNELNLVDWVLLDVRETTEKPWLELSNIVRVPLNELENRLKEFRTAKKIIAICQTGKRSSQAFMLLHEKFPELNVYTYESGIDHFIKNVKSK